MLWLSKKPKFIIHFPSPPFSLPRPLPRTQVGGAAGVTDEDLDRTVDLGDQEAFAHGFEGGGDDGGGDYSGGDDDFVDNDFYDAHHGDELNGTDAEGHPHHHHQGNGSEWGEDYADWDDWHGGHEWGDYSIHEPVKGFIDIDAHVLATPVIADIDGDGQDELIAGVSFFFEREYYDRPEHRWEVAKDLVRRRRSDARSLDLMLG